MSSAVGSAACESCEQGERSETYGGRFTGRVELEMLQSAEADDRPDVARVHFYGGAVSNWHRHPGGQHLLLLEGRGRFGVPGGRARARARRLPRHAARASATSTARLRGADCVWLAITWGATAWEDVAPEPA